MYYPEDPEKKTGEDNTLPDDNETEVSENEEKSAVESESEQKEPVNEDPAENEPAEKSEESEGSDEEQISEEPEEQTGNVTAPVQPEPSGTPREPGKKKSGITVTGPAIAVLVVCLIIFATVIGIGVFKITQLSEASTAEPTQTLAPSENGATNAPAGSSATEPTSTAAPAPSGDDFLSGAAISPESTVTSVTSTPETDIISKCYSSVVAIDLYVGTTRTGSGAGIIYTKDGYILTNYHIVGSNASAYTVQVTLSDGSKYIAKFVCGDMDTDVSVIKIEKDDCTAATIGNSDTAVIGEMIYAIGNPNGEGITVTEGLISALGRTMTAYSTNVTIFLTDQILVSAPINGGNSGGGLFNAKGELIGIVNSKKYTDLSGTVVEGMGYAIPISKAIKCIDTLIQNDGYIPGKAKLGVVVSTTGKTISSGWSAVTYTAVVTSVNEGSPAEAAGIKEGDIIIALGKNNLQQYAYSNALLNDYDALHALLLNYKVGDSTTISVLRPETTKNSYGYQTTTYTQVDVEVTFTDFNYSK